MRKIVCLLLVLVGSLFNSNSVFCGDNKLATKLSTLTVNDMPYHGSIADTVEALRQKAKQLDPQKKGVNIILVLNPEDSKRTLPGLSPSDDSFAGDEKKVADQGSRLKVLPPKYADASIGKFIEHLCDDAGLNYRFDGNVVIIASKNIPMDHLQTRFYAFENACFEESSDGLASIKEYFLRRGGVGFPDGALAVFDSSISRLIAVNTPDNLARIEAIINTFIQVEPQVLVEARYIKISQNDLDDIIAQHKASKCTVWKQVLDSGKAEIIASASVLTGNGKEASIRMVDEIFFPESWGEGGAADKDGKNDDPPENELPPEIKVTYNPQENPTSINGKVIHSDPFAEFGEADEPGIKLVVTPTFDPNADTIDIDSYALISQHIGWTTYKDSKIEKMPIIKTWNPQRSNSSLTCFNGDTILCSSFIEEVKRENGTKERNCFMLLYTPTLLNGEGSPYGNISVKSELKVPGRQPTPLESRLSETMIDSLAFKDTKLQDALVALRKKLEDRGLQIEIDLWGSEVASMDLPTITMELNDISCLEAINYICFMTRLQYHADGESVKIGTEEIFPYDNRSYRFPPWLSSRIRDMEDDREFPGMDSDERNAILAESIKKYFSKRGVSFPEGTTIAYDRGKKVFIFENTTGNLELMESILRLCLITYPQVLTEMSCVMMSDRDVVELLGKDAAESTLLSPDQMKAIINSDKGELLYSFRIRSQSGEEACSGPLSKEFFPESWVDGYVQVVDGNILPNLPNPELGEARYMGGSFRVVAYVSPNIHSILLQICPKHSKLMGWSEYEWAYSIDGKVAKTKYRMPEISAMDLSTNLRVADGQAVCVGRTSFRKFPELKDRTFLADISWSRMLEISKQEGQELMNVYYFVKPVILMPDSRL